MTVNHCGTCTACCRVFAIPELKKPAGQWCQHCDIGKGCKIYNERPAICVDFKCLWLLSQEKDWGEGRLPDALRPDRCKVVFGPTTDEKIQSAITMPGSTDAWRKPEVRRIIDAFVETGHRVVVGPPHSLHKTMIDKYGEREVEMTAPDENGMQWSK